MNRFGSVMRATGGPFGGCPASGAATEHQGVGTHHTHGEVHVSCVFQYKLLPEIAKLIEDEILDPQSIMDFNEWFHRQSPPDERLHQELLSGVGSDWRGRFADPKHDDMSQVPAYIAQDTSENMWSHGVAKADAYEDGRVFTRKVYNGISPTQLITNLSLLT